MSGIPNMANISNMSRLGGGGGGGVLPRGPYTLQIGNAGNLSPADATTYYIGNGIIGATIDATDSRLYVPQRGVIKKCYINVRVSGTLGSTETSSIYVSVTSSGTTTDYLVSSVLTADGNRVFSSTSLNIPVNEGDYICGKRITPTWVTNPTNATFTITMAVEPAPVILSGSKVVIQGGVIGLSPASTTDLFLGDGPSSATDTVRIYIPYTGTITYGIVNIRNSTNGTPTVGTAEFFLDKNAGTYESIGTTTMGSTNVDLTATLTTAVTAGDYLCLRMTNPVWTSAPTGVGIAFTFVLTIT